MNASNDNVPRLIKLNDVATMTSLSKTQIMNLRKAGKFPVPVSLGEKRIAFVRSEVEAWVEQRIAARAA